MDYFFAVKPCIVQLVCSLSGVFFLVGWIFMPQFVHEYGKYLVRNPGSFNHGDHFLSLNTASGPCQVKGGKMFESWAQIFRRFMRLKRGVTSLADRGQTSGLSCVVKSGPGFLFHMKRKKFGHCFSTVKQPINAPVGEEGRDCRSIGQESSG